MLYIIDTMTSPPVVVLRVRETQLDAAGHVETAQRYADQTGHVLVVAQGPDAVVAPNDPAVVHPTAHAPEPPRAIAVAGVGVPSAAPGHEATSLLTWFENLLREAEPEAKRALEALARELFSKLVAKV